MQNNIPSYTKATLWFDGLYEKSKKDYKNIPWAKLEVNPLLGEYLNSTAKHEGKALVIGCGLGDDAEALYGAGYDVVAIDISQSALEIAKKRFPQSNVSFEKENIFEMPQKYLEYFDFVFEAFTIQSLPLIFRENMMKAIVGTLAKNAKLLLIAHKKDKSFQGPPWPLEEKEIHTFKLCGLKELFYKIDNEDSTIAAKKFNILYQK